MELHVLIGVVSGTLLSLAFSLIPKLRNKFEGMEKEVKQQIMLATLFVSSLGLLGISCLNPPLDIGVSCNTMGLWDVAIAFVSAVIANQGIYSATKHVADKVFDGS